MNTFNCRVCGQSTHGRITTQCPEAKLCDDIAKRVQSGQLDFVDGSWVRLKPTESIGDMPADKMLGVVEPKQESMKQMDDAMSSLFEFMDAMIPELSSEANDELTDEDIDLLKNINSVPLAAHIVSELDLPVDQLVSLHKLKRLNYVNLFGGSTDQVIRYHYKSTNKGKEFLKPKPVTLNADHVITLFLLNRRSMSEHEFEVNGYHEEFNWLIENTPLLYPDCRRANYWGLTPVGKEYIQRVLAVPVTPV